MRAIIAFLLSSNAAHALGYEELWFNRNLIMHNAGYCFSSPLGRAVFGNDHCYTKQPVPSKDDAFAISLIAETEALEGCAIDTTRTALTDAPVQHWFALRDVPVPYMGESGCIGWKGANLPLRAARSFDAGVLGLLHPGEMAIWAYYLPGDEWEFVITDSALGWVPSGIITPKNCTSMAG